MTDDANVEIDTATLAAYRELESSATALGLTLIVETTATGWAISYSDGWASGLLASGRELADVAAHANAVLRERLDGS